MEIKVGDHKINIRKWKGKDKKKFVNLVKKPDVTKEEIMTALVYDCIEEKNITLSDEEFRYVISRIRAISLGEDFTVQFYCDECGNVFDQTFKLKDIIKFKYKKLSKITAPGVEIKLGPIRNRKYYIEKIQEDPEYDFLLRVQEFNGNDAFTLEELVDMIDDLDVDVLTKIMEKYYEAKFTVEDVHTVKCECGAEQAYKFDDIPEFFPDSWFQ